jgi:membrane fusion protein, multidrug efflux system
MIELRLPARRVIPGIVAACAVCVICGCRGHDDASAATASASMQLGPENIAIVTRGVVEGGPLISGTLMPVRMAQLRTQVSGPILATYADQGARVAANALLARIDATAIRDAYESARSAVASATIAERVAALQAARYDTLLAAGAVSPSAQETAAQQHAAAQAALENARASLVSAEKQLAYTEVRAPFAGVVSERNVSRGDIVQMGSPLFSVVDPSALELDAAVPADQIGSVRRGAAVSFTLSGYPGRTFAGTIARMSPLTDPATGQVKVFAQVPNPTATLVGGLYATGRIVAERDSGLVAPSGAMDTRNLRPVVERIRGGKVERRDVIPGLHDDRTDRVLIRSGLDQGDTLLLGTAQGIAPGTPVRVLGGPPAAGDTALHATAAQP